ncbi:hypothetical protein XENOCAPTIV_001111, partial [Xenoophorus captivus]
RLPYLWSVAVLKEYNIRCHYETKHLAFSHYKGDVRKNKTTDLLAKLLNKAL